MAEEKPSKDSSQAQRQKAQVLVATSLAAIVGSYLFLGCLLPVIALVGVAVWLVYGGAAAVLVVALPVAAFAFALLWFCQRPRR